MKYSFYNLVRNSFSYHENWEKAWSSPELKPEYDVIIVGGGGYGAKLLPSLACLDTPTLANIGSTKIGTGRYVDCP